MDTPFPVLVGTRPRFALGRGRWIPRPRPRIVRNRGRSPVRFPVPDKFQVAEIGDQAAPLLALSPIIGVHESIVTGVLGIRHCGSGERVPSLSLAQNWRPNFERSLGGSEAEG